MAVVKLLIKAGAQADSKDKIGGTSLSEIPKLILHFGDISEELLFNNGQTPLLAAARNGHGVIFKLLLATGDVYVHTEDKNGWNPLSWATKGGYEDVFKLLLST
ncbi:hypothetical protein DM02DRAFT_656084 [Periconia macrospinosa]|uniref:Uncharacterized protein n=1 Tax=Periconia macrospinosa TaxID=97972 RepID=A0A2V1DNL3_9PLEO|nr:hypothetical protein DM02DRAFT_656084 [Periconia macrospinosa]